MIFRHRFVEEVVDWAKHQAEGEGLFAGIFDAFISLKAGDGGAEAAGALAMVAATVPPLLAGLEQGHVGTAWCQCQCRRRDRCL